MKNNKVYSVSKFAPIEKVFGDPYLDELVRNGQAFRDLAEGLGHGGRAVGTREDLAILISGGLSAIAYEAVDERRSLAEAGKLIETLELNEKRSKEWGLSLAEVESFTWFRKNLATAVADEQFHQQPPDSQAMLRAIQEQGEDVVNGIDEIRVQGAVHQEKQIDELFGLWLFMVKEIFLLIEDANQAEAGH